MKNGILFNVPFVLKRITLLTDSYIVNVVGYLLFCNINFMFVLNAVKLDSLKKYALKTHFH